MSSFTDLGVSEEIAKQLKLLKLNKPTDVQKHCIPLILKGEDIVACSQTGSGKTAAFLIPILQLYQCEKPPRFCLILTPTRELAGQIGEKINTIIKDSEENILVVTGGKDFIDQGENMNDTFSIMVATPGRLAQLIRQNKTSEEWSMKSFKYLVLDEADRLLEDNFGPDLEVIFNSLSKKRKTLLFTATLTGPTLDVIEANRDMAIKNGRTPPTVWRASGMNEEQVLTVDTLKQYYSISTFKYNESILMRLLDIYQSINANSLIIIFVNKCKTCQLIYMMLKHFNYEASMLHSAMGEQARMCGLRKFTSQRSKILVATNLASRGLDIDQIDVVINYNVPSDPKHYVHRVGRTARSGRRGVSITMGTKRDIEKVRDIEIYIGKKLEQYLYTDIDKKEIIDRWSEVAIVKEDVISKLNSIRFEPKNKRKHNKTGAASDDDEEDEEPQTKKARQ